jgi:hypothetical protein
MYTPVLFTLLAATALAFPTPQSFLSGIPGLVMTPNQYTVPGCLGGQICPPWEWYRQLVNGGKPLTAESAETEKNDQSLAVRQERGEDEAGVSAEATPSISCSSEPVERGAREEALTRAGLLLQRRRLGRRLHLPQDSARKRSQGLHTNQHGGKQCRTRRRLLLHLLHVCPSAHPFSRRILTPCSNAVCAPIASDGNDALTLTFPGNDNLGFTAKGDFNDRLLSYQCFRDENYALDPMEKSKAAAFEEAKAATIAEGKMM